MKIIPREEQLAIIGNSKLIFRALQEKTLVEVARDKENLSRILCFRDDYFSKVKSNLKLSEVEMNGKTIQVDCQIAGLIKFLNKREFWTVGSCSGHYTGRQHYHLGVIKKSHSSIRTNWYPGLSKKKKCENITIHSEYLNPKIEGYVHFEMRDLANKKKVEELLGKLQSNKEFMLNKRFEISRKGIEWKTTNPMQDIDWLIQRIKESL